MLHYADGSFLVSCYLPDANTARAKTWLLAAGVQLPFTDLHALEVQNAIRLGAFRGVLSSTEAAAAILNIENDVRARRLVRMPVAWQLAFRMAARLSRQHTTLNGSRSLDILHVAAAKTMRSVELLSFDSRQRNLAAMAGLSVGP